MITSVETALADCRAAMTDNSIEPAAFKEKVEALQNAAMKIGEHIYKSGATASADTSADQQQASDNASGDQTVDADYTEKK